MALKGMIVIQKGDAKLKVCADSCLQFISTRMSHSCPENKPFSRSVSKNSVLTWKLEVWHLYLTSFPTLLPIVSKLCQCPCLTIITTTIQFRLLLYSSRIQSVPTKAMFATIHKSEQVPLFLRHIHASGIGCRMKSKPSRTWSLIFPGLLFITLSSSMGNCL